MLTEHCRRLNQQRAGTVHWAIEMTLREFTPRNATVPSTFIWRLTNALTPPPAGSGLGGPPVARYWNHLLTPGSDWVWRSAPGMPEVGLGGPAMHL